MPDGAAEGILRGMYKLKTADVGLGGLRPQLLGSGPILRHVLKAQEILADRYSISSDAWSVTSYKELRRDALAADRWNRLHPGEPPKSCHLWKTVEGQHGPFIAASDYVRLVQEQIAAWLPGGMVALGTDGFGRSASRESLRRFFEVDAESIVIYTLGELARQYDACGGGPINAGMVREAIKELGYDADKPDPLTV
jgi:pyruvate dehydrogenase E1 component